MVNAVNGYNPEKKLLRLGGTILSFLVQFTDLLISKTRAKEASLPYDFLILVNAGSEINSIVKEPQDIRAVWKLPRIREDFNISTGSTD